MTAEASLEGIVAAGTAELGVSPRGTDQVGRVVDPDELDPKAIYKLLVGTVVPRPIAWVSTISPDGIHNLAPFSFFTIVSVEPPMVSMTFVRREHRDDRPAKDTLDNLRRSRECVVNIVSVQLAKPMAISSRQFESHVDEFAEAGLTAVSSHTVGPPRVGEALVSMECTVEAFVQPGSDVVTVARVRRFHFAPGLLLPNGRVDIETLNPLARLAGNFTRIGTPFTVAND